MIKEILGAIGILILTVVSVITIVQHEVQHGPRTVMVDCGLAEFHPDFTPAMRQACREARMQQTKEKK